MKQFLYQQLANQLKSQIQDHIWQADEKLPSIRVLSDRHKISKISVQKALQELEAMGLIHAKPRSGYYVAKQATAKVSEFTQPQIAAPSLIQVPDIFLDIMRLSAAFDIYPKAGIEIDNQSIQLLHRHINRAMRQHASKNALYYGDPTGDPALKKQIAQHYRARNVIIEPEDICITAGCQNSLFLALSSVCQTGDTIAIESPAFYGVLQLAQSLGLRVIEISASATQGMDTDILQSALEIWPIKACIVTSNFATPTGACMPAKAKQSLVDLAKEHDFTIIEDDIYGDLGFHVLPEPVKAIDRDEHTILCSSFSKSLSRDLRIGWVIGAKYHQQIIHHKLVHHLSSNQALQQGLASFIANGDFRRHLLQYRQQLKKQRDALIAAINQYWQFSFSYTVPDGGLAIWIKLDEPIDTVELYKRALKQDIVLTPGALFSTSQSYQNCLRLSFVHPIEGARKQALTMVNRLVFEMKKRAI
ncbi:PLP-dependent aminotransferase family protein [Marinifaba aquimaris]|uniref:aminotransferase-like domain-containing protein n=1 Tax=Marinifaba aquimaris TaxID=2741323 RepID=UPI0031B5EF79